MEAYIFNADIYCASCAAELPAPPDGLSESDYDSDEYRKGPFSDGGGEADSPQHCAQCHCALENPLTSHGVEYVLEALREYVDGCGGAADVLEGWADQLADYSLRGSDKFVLTAFNRVRELEREREAMNDVNGGGPNNPAQHSS